MIHLSQACNICGAIDLQRFATRSDSIAVLRCANCGHAVVEQVPDDPLALYGDTYYETGETTGSGYEDYHYTAEHGLAWVASLAGILKPSGRLLDIGCADGYLLRKLKHSHDCSGIEVNQHMADVCRAEGFPVLAADLADPSVLANHEGTFDVITAIAVFEHILDFKHAVEIAIRLLKPDGILIFEVPAISSTHDSSLWFRSSLEHIHYPSDQSLSFLFDRVLHLPLVGSEVEIRDFAPTFVGIVPHRSEDAQELQLLFTKLTQASPETLTQPAHRRFRWLFELVHAAQISPPVLELLRAEDLMVFNPELRARLLNLWIGESTRVAELARYLREVEGARDWHAANAASLSQRTEKSEYEAKELAGQVLALQTAIDNEQNLRKSLSHYLGEVEKARDWHAEQTKAYVAEAAELNHTIEHNRSVIAAQASELEVLRQMRESLSWRVTRPLRAVGKMFSRTERDPK